MTINPHELTESQAALQLFAGYTRADLSIFQEFIAERTKSEPGFITDFVGSRIRTTSVWAEARSLDGQVLGVPVPGDFHAEAIEWIGLLKAVRDASGVFVAMELGAGFGPWVVAGALTAKRCGIGIIRLCAVEADPQHFQFLRQHFLDNGIDPDEHLLVRGAVGMQAGVAYWPVSDEAASREQWGCRPTVARAAASVEHASSRVEVVSMRDLVLKEPCWDVVHIDVQGDEVDICRSCLETLTSRVRWLIVGTHSRKLDGDLLELMFNAGWILEHEKPAKFNFRSDSTNLEDMTIVDGTQVWRNPRLAPQKRLHPLSSFSQRIQTHNPNSEMKAGSMYALHIEVENTGTEPWLAGSGAMYVNAGYRWHNYAGEVLEMEGRRASLAHSVVDPGGTESLVLQVEAPAARGKYTLVVSMVQEGVSWFQDKGANPLRLLINVY